MKWKDSRYVCHFVLYSLLERPVEEERKKEKEKEKMMFMFEDILMITIGEVLSISRLGEQM